MFNGIGKEAGLDAVKEGRAAIGEALDKVKDQVVPGLEKAVEGATDHATFSLAGLVADIANRLNGAELPVDLTVTATASVKVSGKIGSLKLSNPEVDATVVPSETVEG